MKEQKNEMIELLKFNKGFTDPERWVEYGITHNFQKIKAEKLKECPDCNARSIKHIGQFVYYSTLVNLQACSQCGLVFTDTRIDPKVISSHFEKAYKDEKYFLHRRRRIFDQIARIADNVAPRGGRVLDVGGAKGHLLARLQKRRPDLNLVLNDLSIEACDHAESIYGFETIWGGIKELELVQVRFDVIILSDVIYYEPDLRKLWDVLPCLLSENGTIIIRVPNKLALIRLWQLINRAIPRPADRKINDKIKFFNPEHLFVFCRRYLLTRLKKLGFHQVHAIPSELLLRDPQDLWHPLFYHFGKIIWMLSFGKIVITPSLLVVAQNKNVSD